VNNSFDNLGLSLETRVWCQICGMYHTFSFPCPEADIPCCDHCGVQLGNAPVYKDREGRQFCSTLCKTEERMIGSI
jgi:hypothetical protein